MRAFGNLGAIDLRVQDAVERESQLRCDLRQQTSAHRHQAVDACPDREPALAERCGLARLGAVLIEIHAHTVASARSSSGARPVPDGCGRRELFVCREHGCAAGRRQYGGQRHDDGEHAVDTHGSRGECAAHSGKSRGRHLPDEGAIERPTARAAFTTSAARRDEEETPAAAAHSWSDSRDDWSAVRSPPAPGSARSACEAASTSSASARRPSGRPRRARARRRHPSRALRAPESKTSSTNSASAWSSAASREARVVIRTFWSGPPTFRGVIMP